MIITHPEKAVATLVKLKERGMSITVDDFGTGYSSLSYLARLPIQAVKIDQRFVHGLEHNRNDEAITQAIIALSHSLGLRVHRRGRRDRARSSTSCKRHGCEDAQGFLIARPLEEPEFLRLVEGAGGADARRRCCSPTCGSRKARLTRRVACDALVERRGASAASESPAVDVAQRARVVDVDPHELSRCAATTDSRPRRR